jgi:hypothetical protein
VSRAQRREQVCPLRRGPDLGARRAPRPADRGSAGAGRFRLIPPGRCPFGCGSARCAGPSERPIGSRGAAMADEAGAAPPVDATEQLRSPAYVRGPGSARANPSTRQTCEGWSISAAQRSDHVTSGSRCSTSSAPSAVRW